MPCRVDWPSSGDCNHHKEISDLRAEVERLTVMLCGVLRDHDQARLPKATKEWWKKHQAADRKRLEDEEAARELSSRLARDKIDREVLLSKLTKQEKELLGIK